MMVEITALERRAALHRALGDPHRLGIVEALELSDLTPGELSAIAGLASNLLAFHLRELEEAGLIERRASDGDRRRRYVRLRAAAVEALGRPRAGAPVLRPLFVCTANSARSPFAAAVWSARTGRSAASAGSAPAQAVHPLAVEFAARRGIDLSAVAPRGYDAVKAKPDLVVSVCDRALERGVPFAAPRVHWSIPDPVAGDRGTFEAVFDEVAERVERLAHRAAA